VSNTDLYSIGNWQGGQYNWGDIDDFQMFSKQLDAAYMQQEMADQQPLLASKKAKLSASSTGKGCSVEDGHFYSSGASTWCSEKDDTGQWLQGDLESASVITAVTVGTRLPVPAKSDVSQSGASELGELKVNNTRASFVASYRIDYSTDGKKWVEYNQRTVLTGPSTALSSTKATLSPPILASHVRIKPVKWTGGIAMSIELHGVPAAAKSLPEITVESTIGGTDAVAQCQPGWAVIGGGCNALSAPNIIKASVPESKTAWRCQGSGAGGVKAMALCTPFAAAAGLSLINKVGGSNLLKMTVPFTDGKEFYFKKASEGDYGATCPDNSPLLVSGGCSMPRKPFKAAYSFASSNTTWMCGGHGGSKDVSMLCAAPKVAPWTRSIKRVIKVGSKDWVTATCPKGSVVVSGGCSTLDGSKSFQYNGPDTPDANGLTTWTCGGTGSKKVVYAFCAPGTAKGKYESQDTGSRGNMMQNPVIRKCQCPKSCKCPTRGQTGFDTTSGVKRSSDIFGSYGFCATSRYWDNKQKTPSCICPRRTPTRLHFEFIMTYPNDLLSFSTKLQISIEKSLRTPGKTCGCKDTKFDKSQGIKAFFTNGTNATLPPGGNCACRISIDRIQKVTDQKNATRAFHWRGDDSSDRWRHAKLDVVHVDAHIAPVDETLLSAKSYHKAMSAESMADRFTQLVRHNESPLRRNWFFMHIAKVGISDRILKGCELKMTEWSYRDAEPNSNLTSAKVIKRDESLATGIGKHGMTDEDTRMKDLIRRLKDAQSGLASEQELKNSILIGEKLAKQLSLASQEPAAAAVRDLVSKMSKVVIEKKAVLQSKLNNGPSHWGRMKKEWWRCDNVGSQSPINLGSQHQSTASFWKTNSSFSNKVAYSNEKEDGLMFEYGAVNATVLNQGLYLRVNFSEGTPTFFEAGRMAKLHWRHNRFVGGKYNLTHADIHSPSEHTIKGKRYPMEIQFYHKNSKGHTVAVAVLLKYGFKNDFLSSIFSANTSIPLQCSASQKLEVHPGDALPLTTGYYAYDGSLTQPPCSLVSWYVLKDQATLSLFQFIDFAKTFGLQERYRMHCSRYGCSKAPVINGAQFPYSQKLGGNVRPLQALGKRRIRATIIPASQRVVKHEASEEEEKDLPHPLDNFSSDKFKYVERKPKEERSDVSTLIEQEIEMLTD
jgi:carbonic anhydrase